MCNALRPAGSWDMYGESITVRRSAYLTLVRFHLHYATQVWTPQSIDLIRKLERVQRRAKSISWIYYSFVTKHMGTG